LKLEPFADAVEIGRLAGLLKKQLHSTWDSPSSLKSLLRNSWIGDTHSPAHPQTVSHLLLNVLRFELQDDYIRRCGRQVYADLAGIQLTF
jgi:hypothetical protein